MAVEYATKKKFGNTIRQSVLVLGLLTGTLISPLIMAEFSGSLRSGYAYTNNLGSQRTVEQGLGTSGLVSRSGWVNQGNLLVESLGADGGQTLGLSALLGKSNQDSSDISDLNLSASIFRAINRRWLWRLSADTERYRDDAVSASGYDGYGAKLTLGYFGDDKQGFDLTLAWKNEEHNLDPLFLYTTDRTWLNVVYYLPHNKGNPIWALQAQARDNNASGDFRDYLSYLIGVNISNWQWGKFHGFASLQWRSNYYDDLIGNTNVNTNLLSALMRNRPPGNPGDGPSNNPPGGSVPGESSIDLNDQLLSAIINFNLPLAAQWAALFSFETSRYTISNPADSQDYYRIFTGVKWIF